MSNMAVSTKQAIPNYHLSLNERLSGVLLHPTSLPGPFGIGDLGPQAHRFVDFLAESGQTWWQMLPIGPAGPGSSPYSSPSAFAGYPLLISLESLAQDGLLGKQDLALEEDFPSGCVDYDKAQAYKERCLRAAFKAFQKKRRSKERERFQAFVAANKSWLDDFSLYSALKEKHGGAWWFGWDPELRLREPSALSRARRRLISSIRYHEFLQYCFHKQWSALREKCRERGIGLIGDVPIYPAYDSAEVWSHPGIFQLDDRGSPEAVAGVPPDIFSKTGQLWGNPLYRWDYLRERGYDWWISRLRTCFSRFDAVRLDHFIGFCRYWKIPAGAPVAAEGRWVNGPGSAFFRKVMYALGPVELIAEDLGAVTPEVFALRDEFGFPGMRILQFEIDEAGLGLDGFKLDALPKHCVVYPGTHDNDTIVGWSLKAPKKNAAVKTEGIHWRIINLAMRSPANTVIMTMQDILGLDSQARMNFPGTVQGNWLWRLKGDEINPLLAERLFCVTHESGRYHKR